MKISDRVVSVCAVAAMIVLLCASAVPGADYPRWRDVPGASDFRDAGGYAVSGGTVARGLLFRSGDLSTINRSGVDALVKLGVKTVVDLRSRPGTGDRIGELSGGAIRVVNLPIVADPFKDKNDYYKRMIVNGRQSLTSLLVLLSEKDNLPVVIFDEGGINEVEVATMFVLLTLGVAGEDAVSDYLLSNQRGADLKREWGEYVVKYFEESGGMEYYVTKIVGLDPKVIDTVRDNLIQK